MAKTFHVDIVTPEAVVWSGEAEMVSARTTEGDIGILADHEATMAALATGAVQVHHDGGVISAGLHGGFRLTEGGLEEARTAAAELRAEVEESEEA